MVPVEGGLVAVEPLFLGLGEPFNSRITGKQ